MNDEILDKTLIPGAFFAFLGTSLAVENYFVAVVSFISIFAYIYYLEEHY